MKAMTCSGGIYRKNGNRHIPGRPRVSKSWGHTIPAIEVLGGRKLRLANKLQDMPVIDTRRLRAPERLLSRYISGAIQVQALENY